MSEPTRYPEGLSDREKQIFESAYNQGLQDAAFDIKENGFSIGQIAHNNGIFLMYDGVIWRQLFALPLKERTA